MDKIKTYFINLNIFEQTNDSIEETEAIAYRKKGNLIATRIFFLVLFSTLIILTSFTWSNKKLITFTIQNPTQDQALSLPNERICPCSHASIPYGKFVSSNFSFHQVCSSDFISDRWIASLFYENEATYFFASDIRSTGFAQFQALASFCRLSKDRANRLFSLFGSMQLTSSILVENARILEVQVMSSSSNLRQSSSRTFRSQIELISMMILDNQLINGLNTNLILNTNIGKWRLKNTKIGVKVRAYGLDFTECSCIMINPFNQQQCQSKLGIYPDKYDIDAKDITNSSEPMISFPNLVTSCMPVESCLLSSLQCLYNQTCVDSIQPYRRTFDNDNNTAMNPQLPSQYNISSDLFSIIENFMIENWTLEVSYDKYFHECSPMACTYSKLVHPNIVEILKSIIGLLGGLCTVFLLIIPLIVRKIREKFWPMPSNSAILSTTSSPSAFSVLKRLKEQILPKLKQIIFELNLFEMKTSTEHLDRQLKYQRVITRIYIILLIVILFVLTINTALSSEIYIKILHNPNTTQFAYLKSTYPSSVQCPCSNISIKYRTFLEIQPEYHQMCSSGLISSEFLFDLGIANLLQREVVTTAYHVNGISLFVLLATLCNHAQETIQVAYDLFLDYTYVTTQAISAKQFHSETNAIFLNWQTTTINNFVRTIQLIRAILHGNHLAGAYSNAFVDLSADWNVFPSLLRLNSSFYYGQCNCMLSASCRSPLAVYDPTSTVADYVFDIPGLYMGCSRFEALLSSTLECFYNQTCIDEVNYYTFRWFYSTSNVRALNSSLNLPNETIEIVVNRMFVNNWIRNVSYEDYYETCAPSMCTYEQIKARSLLEISIVVIGIFGGLSTGLKILFILLLRFLSKMINNTRITIRSFQQWFYSGFNDQKRLKTRFTAILLVITFSILSLLYIFSRISITNQISKPELETYENYFHQYSDTIQCPCSQISISYKTFFHLSVARRHQICSSEFITDRWIEMFLLPNLQSTYSPLEFQTSAIGFFQMINSFCQFTEKYLIDELNSLANQNLIHLYAVSKSQLDLEMQSLIKQFQTDTINSFLNSLELTRMIISNNTIISLFQTNWKWTDLIVVNPQHWGKVIHTKPIVYDNQCSCGLSSECVQQIPTIPGFYVGCYPLEALLKSNLQCLYNQTCINNLQTRNQSFLPLNMSKTSRLSFQSILNELLVEEWISNVSYEHYYNACSPSFCSFTYTTHRAIFDIISSLLGLYGGLVIIANSIATIFVHIYYQRHHRIQPE